MILFVLMCLANPMTWLIAAMLSIAWSRARERRRAAKYPNRKSRARISSTADLAAAFQFLSIAYRPNHAFTAKAQIQQQEDADENDDGSPETPVKHLHRQLRRIRAGEPVDRLTWRLE
jgi:hypothetical protein